MKEATGELNMTVITVVAIAAIAALFYTLVWPAIKKQIESNTKCASAVCDPNCTTRTCVCTYIDGNSTSDVTCPNKNNSD